MLVILKLLYRAVRVIINDSSTSFCLRVVVVGRTFDPFPEKPSNNYLTVFLSYPYAVLRVILKYFHWNYIVTCVSYNIKISFYDQFWICISIRSTPCNWTLHDPIFALLHLFFGKKTLIYSIYFLQLIVLILPKIILSIRNNFY